MYCPKCGTENVEEAAFCAKCGASLEDSTAVRDVYPERRSSSDCFGPSGGAVPGIVFGAVIIFVGLILSLGGNIGQVFGNWGSRFGQFMGEWGSEFGEFMGNWGVSVGRFFADWGTNVGIRLGAVIAIIIGLAIIVSTLSAQGRR